MKQNLLAAAATLLASMTAAQAAGGASYKPMIEFGGGTETAGQGLNVLLRVNAGIVRTEAPLDTIDQLGPEYYLIAHVEGDLAVSPAGGDLGWDRLPYMNIKFTPLGNYFATADKDANLTAGHIALLPVGFERDTRAQRSLAVRVSVVEASYGGQKIVSEKLRLFASITAELLGYKYIAMDEGLGKFKGGRLFGVVAEGGVAMKFTNSFAMHISAGAQADLAFGGHSGFAMQTDHGAFLKVTADIGKFLQIYAQASVTGRWDSQSGYEGVPQFMAGVIYQFNKDKDFF